MSHMMSHHAESYEWVMDAAKSQFKERIVSKRKIKTGTAPSKNYERIQKMNFLFILIFKHIFAADFLLTTEDGQKSKLFSTEVRETNYLTLSHVSKNTLSLKNEF